MSSQNIQATGDPASVTRESKNKNVLLLFYEPCKSGICRHIKYLLQALQSENLTFWIICSGSDEKIPAFFHEIVPADHVSMVPANRFFSLKGFVQTWKTVRHQNIDIVHIHNIGTMLWGYSGSIMGGHSKIIFTPHIDTTCAGITQWFFRRMWRLFNPFTSSLIALTQTQKEWFAHWKIIDPEKISVINNHIPKQNLFPTSDNNVSLPPVLTRLAKDTFVVSQVGRLQRQKDPFFLLRAARLVKKQAANIIFLLVGEGPLYHRLEKTVVQLKLQDTIFLTGHQANVRGILERSDIICLTSRWEGMPYALLEAICYKKAIVATDIPGNRDLIQDGQTGFLVQNEEEFAKRIITLSQSQKLTEKMGENGYRMNQHLFDITNMNKRICDIYKKAAGE